MKTSASTTQCKTVAFRPHHFLCALNFQGAGYSPHFVENFSAILASLEQDSALILSVTAETDAICAPCPHNLKNSLCRKQSKITQLDQAHQQALSFNPGDVISWGDAKAHIKQTLTLEMFHTICAGCEWKSLGLCENHLKDFLAGNS